MATATIPRTYKPGALEMANELGVVREMRAILEQGRRMVRGLVSLEVDADTQSEMGPALYLRAYVDPAMRDDPSHHDWWCWRIDQFGPITAAHFNVAIRAARSG